MLANINTNKKPRPNENADECIQAAANWHVVMHSGEVTATESNAFKQWYQQAENADAYDKFTDIWARFAPAIATPARAAVNDTLTNNKRNHAFSAAAKAMASCFVVVAISSYLLTNTLVGKVLFADHFALSGQLTTITLNDNSQIQLSPFSAVNIHYNRDNRGIELISGRVIIDVAKDINRPLTITSQHGSARALGTQFSVTDLGDYSQVSVYESKVEVCALANVSNLNLSKESRSKESIPKGNSTVEKTLYQCQQLSAGQNSKVTAKGVEKPQAANKGWQINLSQQTLVVDDQPLLNVLAELQAQHFGYIKINKPALQNIRVSGVFPLNDVNHALTVLSATLPIKVNSYSPLLITVAHQ